MPIEVRAHRDAPEARTDESRVFRAAHLLQFASWHQVPAGSLPLMETELIKLSGCRTREAWRAMATIVPDTDLPAGVKLKGKRESQPLFVTDAGPLRGFILCGDARYYHPMICALAVAVWNHKADYDHHRQYERARRINALQPKGSPKLVVHRPDPARFTWDFNLLPTDLELRDSQVLNVASLDLKKRRLPRRVPNREGVKIKLGTKAERENIAAMKLPKPVIGIAEREQQEYEAKRTAMVEAAWNAYCDAYAARYPGITPPRNGHTDRNLMLFVERIGRQVAPIVAAYYVTLENPEYVAKQHPTALMTRDAELLYARYNHWLQQRGQRLETPEVAPRSLKEFDPMASLDE